MSIEEAYGELKGRWQVLQRKCESAQEEVRDNTIECIVLHNICIERGETLCRQTDEIVDTVTNQRTPRDIIRHLLNMTNCHSIRDTCTQATRIRNVLTQELWRESQGYVFFVNNQGKAWHAFSKNDCKLLVVTSPAFISPASGNVFVFPFIC